jgi:hypothetical protein
MMVYEEIKRVINEISSGLEMAGFLDGLNACAIIYCRKYHPEEIQITESGESKISVLGMSKYLNSEVNCG